MPTLLSTFNASIGEIKVRYQEPYVTEGLNAAKSVVVPRGTHRGFRLATNATALTLTFVADPIWFDHVAQYATVDSNDPLGYSHTLTIRRIGGNFTAVLPPSQLLVIAIYATYTTSNPTTAVVNAYTFAEYNALSPALQQELIILGTVVTPASGAIPAASINHSQRVFAGMQIGQDAVPFLKVVDDPEFTQTGLTSTQAINSLIATDWFFSDGGSGVTGNWTQGDPAGNNQLTLSIAAAGGGFSFEFYPLPKPIPVQAGQVIRIRTDIKVLQVPTGGTISLGVAFNTITGGSVSSVYIPIVTTPVDSTYRTLDLQFIVPATAVVITKIEFSASALSYASSGNIFRVSAFQAWMETLGPLNEHDGAMRASRSMLPLIRMPTIGIPTPADPVIHNDNLNSIRIDRADHTHDPTRLPPNVRAQGATHTGGGLTNMDTSRYVANAPTGVTTLTGLSGVVNTNVNSTITLTGAASGTNNGTFTIVAFLSATSVQISNVLAVTPDANNGSISWSIAGGTSGAAASIVVTEAFTLLFSSTVGADPNLAGSFSIYCRSNSPNQGLMLAFNTTWNAATSLWTGNVASYRLFIGASGIFLQNAPVTNATYTTFADTAWRTMSEFNSAYLIGPLLGIPAPLQQFLDFLNPATGGAATEAIVARIAMLVAQQATSARTLLLQTGTGTVGQANTRIYMSWVGNATVDTISPNFELVQGCVWNDTTQLWDVEPVTFFGSIALCSRIIIGNGDIMTGTYYNTSSLAPFADSAFTGTALGTINNGLGWSLSLYGNIKAFGVVLCDTTQSSNPLSNGYNINNSLISLHSTYIQIAMNEALEVVPTGGSHGFDAAYIVVGGATVHGSAQNTFINADSFTNTTFRLYVYDLAGLLDPATATFGSSTDILAWYAVIAPDHGGPLL